MIHPSDTCITGAGIPMELGEGQSLPPGKEPGHKHYPMV